MIFLGTAAAEGYPDPMCTCPSCTEALHSEDPKLKRRRSALLLDEQNIVDFGPDVMYACAEYGCSLAGLCNIFLTHVHEDHFSLWNFGYAEMGVTDKSPMTLYLSPQAHAGLTHIIGQVKGFSPALRRELEGGEQYYRMVPLEPYKEYKIDDMRVLPLRGRHSGYIEGESSLNYVFKTPGQTVLYACDTGSFLPESMEALKDYPLDIAVIEGSFGKTQLPPGDGHMDRVSLCATIDALMEQGTILPQTRIYITHIGHKGIYNHYDYEAFLQARYGGQIQVAYDGLHVPPAK